MTTPEKLHSRLVALGENWADLNAAAELLEGSEKSVLGQYVLEHMAEAKSVAKAEHMARADARYTAHMKIEVEARRKANIAKVNLDAAKTYIDLLRSQESTRRAEMNLR